MSSDAETWHARPPGAVSRPPWYQASAFVLACLPVFAPPSGHGHNAGASFV